MLLKPIDVLTSQITVDWSAQCNCVINELFVQKLTLLQACVLRRPETTNAQTNVIANVYRVSTFQWISLIQLLDR